MSKTIYFVLIAFLAVSLFSGFLALSYKKDIFIISSLLCCNASGVCENPYPHYSGTFCRTNSQAQIRDLCEDLTISCKYCVDLTISGCLCEGSIGSYNCYNDITQTMYYGTNIHCDLMRPGKK